MAFNDIDAALSRSNIRVYWCLGAIFVCFGVGSVVLFVCFIRRRRRRLSKKLSLRKEIQEHEIGTVSHVETSSILEEDSFSRISPVSNVKTPDLPKKEKKKKMAVAMDVPSKKPKIMSPVTFKSTIPPNAIVPAATDTARKSPVVVKQSYGEIPTDPDETGGLRDDNLNIIARPPPTEEFGRLRFSVGYDRQNLALSVTIVWASGLPPALGGRTTSTTATATANQLTDPYVKLQLLPDRQFKAKTRIARKTTEPVYDETFTFYGFNYAAVNGTSLHMSVLSFDRFSRDDVVGDVIFPLRQLDLDDGKTLTFTRALNRRHQTGQIESRGELLVSVCHQPSKENLTVTVLKGRNLPKINIAGLADPYVKVYMSYRGQRIAKRRTRVATCMQNPVFNESFVFRLVREQVLRDTELELFVLDWDEITNNEVLGRVRLGLDHKGSGIVERKHWTEVVRNPAKQLAVWHRLKA